MAPIDKNRNLVLTDPVNLNSQPVQKGLVGIMNPLQSQALYPNRDAASNMFRGMAQNSHVNRQANPTPAPPPETPSRQTRLQRPSRSSNSVSTQPNSPIGQNTRNSRAGSAASVRSGAVAAVGNPDWRAINRTARPRTFKDGTTTFNAGPKRDDKKDHSCLSEQKAGINSSVCVETDAFFRERGISRQARVRAALTVADQDSYPIIKPLELPGTAVGGQIAVTADRKGGDKRVNSNQLAAGIEARAAIVTPQAGLVVEGRVAWDNTASISVQAPIRLSDKDDWQNPRVIPSVTWKTGPSGSSREFRVDGAVRLTKDTDLNLVGHYINTDEKGKPRNEAYVGLQLKLGF